MAQLSEMQGGRCPRGDSQPRNPILLDCLTSLLGLVLTFWPHNSNIFRGELFILAALAFQLDFPGNLCRAAFAILAICLTNSIFLSSASIPSIHPIRPSCLSIMSTRLVPFICPVCPDLSDSVNLASIELLGQLKTCWTWSLDVWTALEYLQASV